MPPKIDGFYLRVWILKRVLILSTNKGFNSYKKDRVKFKFIFGIEGERNERDRRANKINRV